jgi:hypothetical protein
LGNFVGSSLVDWEDLSSELASTNTGLPSYTARTRFVNLPLCLTSHAYVLSAKLATRVFEPLTDVQDHFHISLALSATLEIMQIIQSSAVDRHIFKHVLGAK